MIAAIDLFCGLGGLSYGLTAGGVRVLTGIDIDPECQFPYQSNNEGSFLKRDVRELTSADLCEIWQGAKYTLLAGCAPCQPFSNYSRKGRNGRNDAKWELVSHFGRLAAEAKPDFVTMENVPQLLEHGIFRDFLQKLDGYFIWYKVVQCAEYGVPQTRKRLVLIASRLGPINLDPPILTTSATATVRKAIFHLRPLAAGEADPADALHSAPSLSELNLKRIKASTSGGTWRDWNEDLIATCHRKSSGETYPSVYGRMEWDAPSPTITTQCFGYGNGRFGHPEQDRAISLREAAILQTFPSCYQFLPAGKKARFSVLGRLIGNAVPVKIGEVVATSLFRHLDELSAA